VLALLCRAQPDSVVLYTVVLHRRLSPFSFYPPPFQTRADAPGEYRSLCDNIDNIDARRIKTGVERLKAADCEN